MKEVQIVNNNKRFFVYYLIFFYNYYNNNNNFTIHYFCAIYYDLVLQTIIDIILLKRFNKIKIFGKSMEYKNST